MNQRQKRARIFARLRRVGRLVQRTTRHLQTLSGQICAELEAAGFAEHERLRLQHQIDKTHGELIDRLQDLFNAQVDCWGRECWRDYWPPASIVQTSPLPPAGAAEGATHQ